MKTRNLWGAAALLLMMGTASMAWAWGGDYGKGDPKNPVGNSTWPTGTELLANRTDRIGGFWINASDTFFYAGDAKAFNDFLQHYAQVQCPHYLSLRSDKYGRAFALQPLHGDHQDWDLQAGYGSVSVGMTLDGRIPLRSLRIPRNVQIGFEGTPSKEIAAFVARHNAQLPKNQ